MTLRLFCLRDPTSRRAHPDLFFASKPTARTSRDVLNAKLPRDPSFPHRMPAQSWTVCKGPDHKDYHP